MANTKRYAWRCSGRTSGATVAPCDFQTLSLKDAVLHFERTNHDTDKVEISADCDAPCFEDDPCGVHVGRSVPFVAECCCPLVWNGHDDPRPDPKRIDADCPVHSGGA
jgi:hypothetical protein